MDYKQALAALLVEKLTYVSETEICETDIREAIETPPDTTLGHFAYPCFKLAKHLRKAPPLIAKELADSLRTKRSTAQDELDKQGEQDKQDEQSEQDERPLWLADARATGAYVNFFIDRAFFMKDTLSGVLAAGSRYGATDRGDNRTVLVEYSSPNIAKHFHVGHFANTVIGQALANVFDYLGYHVVRLNFLGDWGTQFGRLITAYKKWGSREEIEQTGIDGLTQLYVRFHEESEQDPALKEEARAWVVRMQNGDEEGLSLWRWFCALSMDEYNRIYTRLHVAFDDDRGESYYTDKMDAVARELSEKGLLVESEGARIVDLEAYNMPPCLILRSDGGTLYPTRDIAAALDRYQTYRFHKSIYVTGNEQALHFAQWMKVVSLMGYPWAKDMTHVTYGLFVFDSGKMSTRRGQVFKIEELLEDAVAKTLAIITEKNPNLPDKATVAEQVGVGAIIFNQMYNNRIKDVPFSWERMLNFEGETGPYVQYTHARACSVLEKAAGIDADIGVDSGADIGADSGADIGADSGADIGTDLDYSLLTDDEAFEVARLLRVYPEKIVEAAEKYEPFLISRHMVALAQGFNKFYHVHTVLVDEPALRAARLALTNAVRLTLCSGLTLLGIAAPKRM